MTSPSPMNTAFTDMCYGDSTSQTQGSGTASSSPQTSSSVPVIQTVAPGLNTQNDVPIVASTTTVNDTTTQDNTLLYLLVGAFVVLFVLKG